MPRLSRWALGPLFALLCATLLAIGLAPVLMVSPAHAGQRCATCTNAASSADEVILIDPATGLPYAAGGSGGGGATSTFGPDNVGVSPTKPPVQLGGVGDGGLVVRWKFADDGIPKVEVVDGTHNGLDYTQPSSVYTPDSRAIDQPLNSATSNAAYTVTLDKGEAEVGFSIQGLTASGATLAVETSNNIAGATPLWTGTNAVSGSTQSTTITADGNFFVSTGGRTAVRLRVSVTGTGTITISHSASTASSLIRAANRFPVMAYDTGGTDATNTSLHAVNVATPLYPTTDLTRANITFSSSGDQTLVAAVTSQSTKVYRLIAVSACAQNLTFKTGSTARSGPIPVSANGSVVLDFSPRPWFTTAANEAFILNGSVACQVSGWLEYVTN